MCISTANAKIAHDNEVNQCEHASCEDRSKGVLLTTELSYRDLLSDFMRYRNTVLMVFHDSNQNTQNELLFQNFNRNM